jgi:hypothetical protein
MSKKEIKTKNKCSTEKVMATLPRNMQGELPELMLYLFTDGSYWCELSNRPSVAKGFSWSISEVRHEGVTPSMLSVQYTPRRKRGGVLRKGIARNWRVRYGKIAGRQTSDSKSISSLRETSVRLHKDFGELK